MFPHVGNTPRRQPPEIHPITSHCTGSCGAFTMLKPSSLSWDALALGTHTSLPPQTMGEQAAPVSPSPPPLPPVSQAALAPASYLQDALGEQPAQEAESVLAPGVKDLPPALVCGCS